MAKINVSSQTLHDPKFYYKAKKRGPSYALRKKLGWTQERVAEFLGYGIDSVRAWDIGGRNIPEDVLAKLAAKANGGKK